MATIRAFNERVQSLSEDIFMDVFMEESFAVEELNKNQLDEGLDSKGKKLTQYKYDSYAEYKHELNSKPGYGNPDLNLTGDFYSGFKVEEKGGTKYDITSLDRKTQTLTENYGIAIFGLSEESGGEFVTVRYRPALTKKFKGILKL